MKDIAVDSETVRLRFVDHRYYDRAIKDSVLSIHLFFIRKIL